MKAAHSVMGSALHAQRAISRYGLENDLRAWYLRTCQERIDSDKHGYFNRRREARRWFKELCNNQHFRNVLAAFRQEKEPLTRAISLVSWLMGAQQTVNNQFLPYKKAERLYPLEMVDTKGGLQVLLSPALDDRVPDGIKKRPTMIAGLLDFLGLPSTGKEVTAALYRYRGASVTPAKPGAIEVTRMLRSWGAPNRGA